MLSAAGMTDIGKNRSINQDVILVSAEPVGVLPNLFVVADGMGGHNAGEVASAMAVKTFCENIQAQETPFDGDSFLDLMVSAAAAANNKVLRYSMTDPSLAGMGTTLTGCVVSERKCEIIHIGDSRAYLISHGVITQLTQDHSYVNEMVRAGHLTQNQARIHPKRNMLTRVLGVDLEMQTDGYVYEIAHKDLLLLCSDGLTNMLTDAEILATIERHGHNPEQQTRALIDAANANGGLDNISVVILCVNP